MVSNAESVQLDNDDAEPNDFQEDFGEEHTEEYEAEDVFSESSTQIISVEVPLEQPTATPRVKSSSDTFSTNYLVFESSSSMKSIFSAVSYPSDLSQSVSYLQSPYEVGENVSSSEIDSTSFTEIENRMKSYSVGARPSNQSERKISTAKMNLSDGKCKFSEIPYLHEILEQVLVNTKFMFIKSKVLFTERLKISIIDPKTQSKHNLSPAPNLWLPEEDFAGEFTLNVDHVKSGVLVETFSRINEGSNTTKGTLLFAKLTKSLQLIEEKKTEFQENENERQEKSLHVCVDDDKYLTFRSDKLNDTVERFRGQICINDKNDFVLDGNILGLMRHFIAGNYSGCFQCYSISIKGRVLRQVFWVKEKTSIKINQHSVQAIPLRKSTYDYFTNKLVETSKTFYTPRGAMIYHTWQHSPYIVHMDPIAYKHRKKLYPCMELTWRSDKLLKSLFEIEKCSADCQLRCYLEKSPEIIGFLNDFLIALLHKKPKSVLGYTCDFFE